MALVALSFPPVEAPGLLWIALVPWLGTLAQAPSLGAAVAQGFWLDFLLGFTNAFSVALAVPRYLEVPAAWGLVALFVYSLLHQLPLALFAGVRWWADRAAPPRSFAVLLFAACAFTGLDWATPKLFPITLGHGLHDVATLRQLVAFGGAPALTLLLLAVNLGAYALLHQLRESRGGDLRGSAHRIAWIALPLLAATLLGAQRGAAVRESIERAPRIRVGFVQGSVPETVRSRWARGDAEAAREALEVYLRATRRLIAAAAPPELVIWPETSYPGIFRKPESEAQLRLNVAFDRFLVDARTPLVFGGYDRNDDARRRVLRNALYLVTPRDEPLPGVLSPMQVYHKSILFPIGEYLPFVREPTARRWLPGAAHLEPGNGARVLELRLPSGRSLRLGPMICYEDLFASHAVELARAGAELLVNVSNDAWFGDHGAARLHWIMARLRSVETGLSQIRVTNSGYSVLFTPDGGARHGTDFGPRVARTVEVPIVPRSPTLRARWGDWLGPTCLALGLLGLARERRSGR